MRKEKYIKFTSNSCKLKLGKAENEYVCTCFLTHSSNIVVGLREVKTADFGVLGVGFSSLEDHVPSVRHRDITGESVELHVFGLSGKGCTLRNCAVVPHVFGKCYWTARW